MLKNIRTTTILCSCLVSLSACNSGSSSVATPSSDDTVNTQQLSYATKSPSDFIWSSGGDCAGYINPDNSSYNLSIGYYERDQMFAYYGESLQLQLTIPTNGTFSQATFTFSGNQKSAEVPLLISAPVPPNSESTAAVINYVFPSNAQFPTTLNQELTISADGPFTSSSTMPIIAHLWWPSLSLPGSCQVALTLHPVVQ